MPVMLGPPNEGIITASTIGMGLISRNPTRLTLTEEGETLLREKSTDHNLYHWMVGNSRSFCSACLGGKLPDGYFHPSCRILFH